MKAKNVFSDDVRDRLGGLPELVVERGFAFFGWSAERAHVVHQGVEPDVDDVLGVVGHRDTPAEARPRDRQIAQPLFDERLHFVETRFGLHEIRMRLVVVEERLRVLAQPEEVAALLDALDRLLMNRAEVALEQLLLGLERLASDAVPILVVVEVDVAPGLHELPERLNVFAVLGEVVRMKPSWAQPSSSQASGMGRPSGRRSPAGRGPLPWRVARSSIHARRARSGSTRVSREGAHIETPRPRPRWNTHDRYGADR